jgi:pimeloyl-ACP methyl ester carboxylesterase
VPSDSPVTVLVHSPLVGPASWGHLPEVLRARGDTVVVVDVADDDRAPYASRYVARAALQVRDAVAAAPVVLVGHSGAGYLLPLLGAARRALRSRVAAYVFCDAGLPPARPMSRLDLLTVELSGSEAVDFAAHLDGGGRYPEWTDDELRELVPGDEQRAALVASLRPRSADFYREQISVAPDWPDAPCGFVQLSAGYDRPARAAAARGWPVVSAEPAGVPGGHFAPCVGPERVADLLAEVRGRL